MELSMEIAVYCWFKFNLKSQINLLLISNRVITGTFLPLAKVFKIDQYVLALVLGMANFAANLLWYSVLESQKFNRQVLSFS